MISRSTLTARSSRLASFFEDRAFTCAGQEIPARLISKRAARRRCNVPPFLRVGPVAPNAGVNGLSRSQNRGDASTALHGRSVHQQLDGLAMMHLKLQGPLHLLRPLLGARMFLRPGLQRSLSIIRAAHVIACGTHLRMQNRGPRTADDLTTRGLGSPWDREAAGPFGCSRF